MKLLTIDETLCKHDSLCVLECPVNILQLDKTTRLPVLKPGCEPSCLRCGHCVAVCPEGAFDHAEVPLSECPAIEKDLMINQAQALQFLRSRRSARVFTDQPVERDKIQKLIEFARYAPSGSNLQLVEWVVYDDRSRLHEFSQMAIDWMRHVVKDNGKNAPPYIPMLISAWDKGRDVVLRNAPALILAMTPDFARNGLVDCALALSYLDLIAPKSGLSTCWAGLLQGALLSWPSLREFMGVPKGFTFHYPMMIGYTKTKYYRLPARKPPKITWR